MPDVVWKIALPVAAAAAVVLTVRKLPDLWHRPRPDAEIPRWFDGDQAARAWPVVAVLGSVALAVVSGAVWLSDGDAAPEWAGGTVTASLVALFAVGSCVGWLGRPRFLVPPALRTREGRDALHEVVIHDVRPAPGSEDEYPPYFIAICASCDWLGRDRPTEEEARRDAAEHTPHVREAVERPVG